MSEGSELSEKLIHLVDFNPDDDVHVAELRRQRILCGWNIDLVDTWCTKHRQGAKNLVWIMRCTNSTASAYFETIPLPERESFNISNDVEALGPPSISEKFRPIGHASLDWEDSENEETLASRTLGNVTFTCFFLLNSQQGRGLGSRVMDLLESTANEPPYSAKYITLTTLDGDSARDPEWWPATLGVAFDPKRRINEDWYARRGYEVMKKRVSRYKEINQKSGETVTLNAVYMRKKLNPIA